MLGGPSGRDAADERRLECREAAHPQQRLLALAPQRRDMRLAAEQGVMLDQRRFDLAVVGQRLAFRKHQLARGLALRQRPVGDAVLGDEARRGLRDAHAVLRVAPERVGAVRPAAEGRVSAVSHRDQKSDQNSWSRASRAGAPGVPSAAAGAEASDSRLRGVNSE